MTLKIFSVATFTLVAWLSVTLVTTSKQLIITEQLLSAKVDTSHQALNERITSLERSYINAQKELLAELKKRPAPDNTQAPVALSDVKVSREPGGNTEPPESQLVKDPFVDELMTAYKLVVQTETEKNVNAPEAAEKLLSTKEAIWKASLQHEQVQERLQELMGPIDSLAAKWKRGDTDNTVKSVSDVLRQTLATLEEP